MTWSYSGDPADSDLDAVRFLLGDIDTTNQLISDEELLWVIEEFDNIYFAAAAAADTLASKFSSEYESKSADGLSISNNKYQKYRDLAARLRKMATRRGGMGIPYAGGLSRAERSRDDADGDLPGTTFRSGMHDIDGDQYQNPLDSSWSR